MVVSQPMYLPWPGLFEQVKRADHFVHYDDVQLPQGRSFVSRVQLKTGDRIEWLSVPLVKSTRHLIKDVEIDSSKDWFATHRRKIGVALGKAPHFAAVAQLLDEIGRRQFTKLADLNIFFIELVAGYLGFRTVFSRSSSLSLTTKSSRRLLDICRHYGASSYLTGQGAKNYLDHRLFEEHGIAVDYMEYDIAPYPQSGTFTPFVTILALLAAVERDQVASHLTSSTVPWRDYVQAD
ncbi:MAG: WbqC family protein [Alphaproteobacteria bacterium]